MSEGYVWAGYGITVGSLALYALRVLRRERALGRSVPGDGGATAADAPAGDR